MEQTEKSHTAPVKGAQCSLLYKSFFSLGFLFLFRDISTKCQDPQNKDCHNHSKIRVLTLIPWAKKFP